MKDRTNGARALEGEMRRMVLCTAAFQQADRLLEMCMITEDEYHTLRERIWSGYYPEMAGLYVDKA